MTVANTVNMCQKRAREWHIGIVSLNQAFKSQTANIRFQLILTIFRLILQLHPLKPTKDFLGYDIDPNYAR